MSTLYDPTDWRSGTTPFSAGNMNKIEAGIRAASPVGQMTMWPLPDPPVGWLLCDGSEVARATYPDLWDWVDSNGLVAAGLYGAGDGSTTFTLPDGRGRFPRSPSTGIGGGTGGATDHSHTNPSTGSAGSHSHQVPDADAAGSHQHSLSGAFASPDLVHKGTVDPGSGLTVSFASHEHGVSGGTTTTPGHQHSIGDTSAEPTHKHTQGDTGTEDHLPPYLELWFIVAT